MSDRILTQHELMIDLSVPAMEWIAREIARRLTTPVIPDGSVECEIENFRNTLLNLIERGVDCASRRQLTDEELRS